MLVWGFFGVGFLGLCVSEYVCASQTFSLFVLFCSSLSICFLKRGKEGAELEGQRDREDLGADEVR